MDVNPMFRVYSIGPVSMDVLNRKDEYPLTTSEDKISLGNGNLWNLIHDLWLDWMVKAVRNTIYCCAWD